MRYEIDAGIVFRHRQTRAGSLVQEVMGMQKRIFAGIAHNPAPGEPTTVTLQWQVFDTERGQYVDDQANWTQIPIDAGGTAATLEPVLGLAAFDFSADEAGEYLIQTKCENVGNAELVVFVQ